MKEKIEKLYIKSIYEDLSPNLFAGKILLLFGHLPDTIEWTSTKDTLPENGDTVTILTDTGRISSARFENLLGNFIWETDYDYGDDETVIGWKKTS